jgi:hypothetical protein
MTTKQHSVRSYYIYKRQNNAAKTNKRFCPKCDLDKNPNAFPYPKGSRAQKAWCQDCRNVKTCPKCLKTMPRATHFRQLKNKPNMAYCFDCQREYNREHKLKNLYQMTQKEYEIRLKNQGGVCFLCKSSAKLVIDHDHVTNKVRGILCDLCNRGLGYFKDNPDVLRLAANYVERGVPSV